MTVVEDALEVPADEHAIGEPSTERRIAHMVAHDRLGAMSLEDFAEERTRGERGLAQLEEMQADHLIEVAVHESNEVAADETKEGRMLQIAVLLGARIMTADENLAKVGRLRGIEVLNLHELSDALRPAVVVGERIRLALVRGGKDEHQGVGYLPDGTMIVVNHAADRIGSSADVRVISTLRTVGGRMVFAELAED